MVTIQKTTTIKELKTIEDEREREGKFRLYAKNYMIDNKQEFKKETLQNGMQITGIGEKCLKIENNFYSWEDIYEAAINDTEDEIMKNILAFIFEDYTLQTDNYTARKFTRSEALQNFENVKKEIIENKQYYKKGSIVGIGEKAIMMKGYADEKEYCKWEEIEEILRESSIRDYKLTHIDYSSISYIAPIHFIEELFVDDEKETQVEKNLREKQVEYAEEKAYIYRHILADDLTVEQIRSIMYNNHMHHANMDEREEIINELMRFAFKYVKEIKFTNEEYDEEDSNKYAIKNGKSYMYTIENKELTLNKEEGTATFTDYDEVTFKAEGCHITIYRGGEKVHKQQAGLKNIYIRKGKQSYTLSRKQQVQILVELGRIQEADEEDIKREFIETCTNEYSEIGSEINDVLLEDAETSYNKYKSVQALAKELYRTGSIHQGLLYRCLRAVNAEQKNNIDTSKILDYIIWDEGNSNKAILLQDKYDFSGNNGKRIIKGFAEYTYSQNCEYTHITQSSSYIDSFSVEEIYIKGDVDEDDAIDYLAYASGMSIMKNTMQYGYIFEGYYEETNIHYTIKI